MFVESPILPHAISFGAQFGINYLTDVVVVASGKRFTNSQWSAPLMRGQIGRRGMDQDITDQLIAFFRTVAKGKANAFRIRDWTDYKVTAAQGLLLDSGASPTHYALFKAYVSGSYQENRRIYKPVSGTVTIQGGGSYTVDYAGGYVIHNSGAAPTSWAGQFDVPAQFDSDELALTIENKNASTLIINWGDIPIAEIRPDE